MGGTDEDFELLTDNKGNVKQTLGNIVKALCHDPATKDMFRFNEMSGKIEVIGAWWKRSSASLTDNDINNIRLYLEQKYGLSHEKHVPRAIEIIANQNPYHPIREFLNGLDWDGGEYIGNVLPKYLGAEKSQYTEAALKLTMLGAIKRVFEPGAKFDCMLCLVDERQGGGKSTIARLLAGKDEWFSDDIKNLDDENVCRKLQNHWIIEFSEMLATSNTRTVEGIKSFLTRQRDTYKIPYEKYAKDFPRQCVFIGTTNNLDFLPNDKTGNRRFIPALCNSEKAEAHPMENEEETREYIRKAWAEAMAIYRSGEYSLEFPKELQEELNNIRRQFTPEDPRIGIIQEWLDNCGYDTVCSQMIYKEALGNMYQEPKPWELRDISKIMNTSIVGWQRHPTSDSKVRIPGYGKQRAWDRCPPQETSPDGFISVDDNCSQLDLPFP